MHEALVAIAALCPPVRCLGVRLRPLALGHRLLLDWLENPLAASRADQLGTKARRSALVQAVWICSRPWRAQRRLPACRARLWGWWLGLRRTDWLSEEERFLDYLTDGSLILPADVPSGANGEVHFIGAPALLRVYAFLATQLPQAEWRAWGASLWDFPLGLGLMLYQADLENRGAIEIYNERQRAHDEFVARMEAEERAAAAGRG